MTTGAGRNPPRRGVFPPLPDDLEHRLGLPMAEDNPLGFTAVLAADELAEVLEAGERVLDDYGLNAEFVPAGHGGRLSGLDRMVYVLRTACRRDPVLGLGYGMSSLMAAVNVWTSGSRRQQERVAELLLGNRKLACAFHELEHGNDLARAEFVATPSGAPGADSFVLSGRKQVIGNVERADAIVLFARTGQGPGSRSHSLLLLDMATLPRDGYRYLPRFHTSGLRGMALGGIEFLNCPVPASSVVGVEGHALETALRAFQITKVALPGSSAGILDTALRTAVRFTLGRRLYGRKVADLPYPRGILGDAFADLLVSDCFAMSVTRALHVLPGEGSTPTAAVKLLVPTVLVEATKRLSALLGAQFYLRSGEYSMMQKLVRDSQPSAFVHASRSACRMSILPQLPLLARRGWSSGVPAPAQVFRPGGSLPPLRFEELSLSSRGQDHLGASLLALAGKLPGGSAAHREVQSLVDLFAGEWSRLSEACSGLPPRELTVTASPLSYRLADRYALLLAAGCCVGVWLESQDGADPFLRHPSWLIAVLTRLAARLGRPRQAIPDHVQSHLFGELLRRYHDSRAFDLSGQQLMEWHP
ncbi:acyl-CoA dehydrogenase [Amycolatopsis sp. H20-H5]|uniref:acyl-CoA dehydrogenase n=1 Tax=Amycolatopsis sp. H20-H5 TaxID=3046309 RepID=UPI002DBA640C|nr:acyl-CoA dehydrogenase [Amycolatopsis sp. H20-H5]MEC3975527.1 acyl-CoA dehydrogenase [Amycolatopsis sp. H20-H5]